MTRMKFFFEFFSCFVWKLRINPYLCSNVNFFIVKVRAVSFVKGGPLFFYPTDFTDDTD